MDSDLRNMTEKDAIEILKTLKTSAGAVERKMEVIKKTPQLRLKIMRSCVEQVGLTVEDLDHLKIIHVTRTKGKGSTCAFTEQILRGYGFRTGFFSSPHLVQHRERIRINSQPIETQLFTKYLQEIYGKLEQTKEDHDSYEGMITGYFCLLAFLGFHVFLQEKIHQLNGNILEENTMTGCLENEQSWHLHNSQGDNNGTQLFISDSLPLVSEKKAEAIVFPCILSAPQWITQGRDSVVADLAKTVLLVQSSIVAKAAWPCNAGEIHVLITGSLYLFGGVLQLLDPVYSK